MVVNRRDGSRPTERAVMHVVNSPRYCGYAHDAAQGRYVPAKQDRAANDPDKDTAFSYTGAQAKFLPEYLQAYGIAAGYYHFPRGDDAFGAFIEHRYQSKFPAILKVYIGGSRPHFIVLEGFQSCDGQTKTKVIISDPARPPIGGAKLAIMSTAPNEQDFIQRSDNKMQYHVGEAIECSW